MGKNELYKNEEKTELALLVSVDTGEFDAQASLAELYELTRSAGQSRLVPSRKNVPRTIRLPVSVPA